MIKIPGEESHDDASRTGNALATDQSLRRLPNVEAGIASSECCVRRISAEHSIATR
jgi:hypothetical protein